MLKCMLLLFLVMAVSTYKYLSRIFCKFVSKMSTAHLDQDEPSKLLEDVKLILKKSDLVILEEYCYGNENEEKVCENGWELLSLLMKHLKEEKVGDDELDIFRNIFTYIASIGNSKELLLGILEQFDPMVELSIVELLFPALNTVCRRLVKNDKKNHCHNLSMVFSSLVYYAESLNLPKYNNFDPLWESEVVSEENNVAKFVSECTDLGISVLNDVLQQFADKSIHENHLNAVKQEYMNFCSGLLERLSFLDLDEIRKSNETAKPVCSNCNETNDSVQQEMKCQEVRQSIEAALKVCSLVRMLHSPWSLLCNVTWKNISRSDRKLSDEECERIEQARACFLYLTIVKHEDLQCLPQIAHPEFAFTCCVPSVLILIKTPNPILIHKGLELCRHVSNRLAPKSLTCAHLSHTLKNTRVSKPAHNLLNFAINVSIHCPSKTLRQRSVQFLTRFLDKFIWMDRYTLLYYLLTTVDHTGVVGYLTGYFKDKLSEILQDPMPSDCSYFMEKFRLDKLLDACLILRDGCETDLLAEYDRLMSSLNLLRFLFIRDSCNKTGIWDKAKSIEREYLNHLRTGINLSRMHFRDELERQSLTKKAGEPKRPEFTINGVSLPSLPVQDRKRALESAIYSFDMMQNVCIRAQQLIDERPA